MTFPFILAAKLDPTPPAEEGWTSLHAIRLDFNLAYIPADFTDKPSEQFDPLWMRKLFDRGYELAKAGYPWKDAPPDFVK